MLDAWRDVKCGEVAVFLWWHILLVIVIESDKGSV